MTMRRKAVSVLAAGACLALFAGGARAQTADHLKCYKVRDSAPRIRYTANLTGLAPESGCVIKVPAKLLCVATTKTAVTPTPPGGVPSGPNAGLFVCYKVKCPRGAVPAVSVKDQFATHGFTPAAAKLLCAPATLLGGGTTTTTTPGVTTTTLPTGLTCGQTAPACNAPCPSGVCSLVVSQSGPPACVCVPGSTACSPSSTVCAGSNACPSGTSCMTNPLPMGPGCACF